MMNQLHKILAFALMVVILIACKKDDDCPSNDSNENGSYSDLIVLGDLQIQGDTIVLNWSKLETIHFRGYQIVRKEAEGEYTEPGSYNPNIIETIYDPEIRTFTDTEVPLTGFLEYQIIGMIDEDEQYGFIYSNSQKYERPEIQTFTIHFKEVIPDIDNNRFYFTETSNGKIHVFNFEELRLEKTLDTEANIGYCSLGEYNSIQELYVPRSDGWVFVYDAETLVKRDQIDIAQPSSCVVSNNGILYISTDAWTNRPLRVYNRDTHAMIYEGGDFDDTRLRVIPGTQTEIMEVTINIGPVDINRYTFDSNGNHINSQNDPYHGDYPLDDFIFQFFPNNEGFITSYQGAIYDMDMHYVNRLPRGEYKFSDFAFSENGNTVYASCSNSKSILAYSLDNFMIEKKFNTLGYPLKIYRKGNELICISGTEFMDSSNFFVHSWVIERIAL